MKLGKWTVGFDHSIISDTEELIANDVPKKYSSLIALVPEMVEFVMHQFEAGSVEDQEKAWWELYQKIRQAMEDVP